MIKKYFALSIIALSVAMVGCSSDDDDDDSTAGATTDGATTAGATTAGATTAGATTAGATTAGATTDGGATDGGATDGGATDGATTDGATTDGATTDGATTDGETTVELTAEATVPEVSAYDFVASSTEHSTLLAALDANPAIANAADDDAAPITLIAPDNAAFDALVAATDGSDTAEELLANESELVTRTLQYHAIGSVVDITDTTPATDTLLVDDGTAAQLTFQAGTAETAAAVDSAANAVDLVVVSEAATGNLYSAASVLVAPDAPETTDGGTTDGGTTDGGTTDGGTTDGEPAGDHVGAGNTVADAFAAQLSGQYTGTNVDDGSTNTTDLWAFFIPDDAATDGTTIDFAFLQSHVDTDNGATRTFDATGFPDGGSITVNGGQTYAITNDGTTITVGGATITQLGTTPQGGFIYAADAILVP